MKNKVFEKMREYGWNLGDNTDKDFADVYNTHYNFIEGCYDYIADCDMNEPLNMNDISASGFEDMITFMSDFLRALNDIDKPKTKEDKIREYITSRNIQYDLVGEDLFGEYDNKDLDTSEISGKLGLSNKSITKLAKIRFEKNIQNREFMLYALNEIIENIDLLEFGKLLLIPNKDNKYIKPEDKYYSDYINYCQNEKEKEYNDFLLNKRLFQMFENIRNSQECAKIFIDYVDREKSYKSKGKGEE